MQCRPGKPCTGANECCGDIESDHFAQCGTTEEYCYSNILFNYVTNTYIDNSRKTQKDLCGPCTTPNCFDPNPYYPASNLCPKQVGEFKDCRFIKECIDGKIRITITRQPIQTHGSSGIDCPSQIDVTCNNCELSTWSDCSNNNRTRTITKDATNGGLSCPNESSLIQTCNNCEVSTWSNCSNNKRTRIITKNATNGGTCNDILTEPCNDCEFSIWSNCSNNNRTRKKTKEATNGGTCNDILTEPCNNCEFSLWTNCSNNNRTRKRTKEATNGGTCNDILTEQCNDCEVSTWSECLNNQRTRIITKTATNSGTCNDILTEPCDDCVGIWDDWTSCEANCNGVEIYKIGYRTSKYRIITPENNGGKSCNIDDGKIKRENNCIKNCVGNFDCSKWSECDCNTKTISRNCKGIIQKKNCSNNCENKNVFNYIIDFLNYIALIIMNFLKL